ncbi:MAG: KH domain-containing protein, partial [Rhodobacteraceae bacterium]|nr:KH domain-containing protein [Paracoccaceae bacterium]
MTDTDSEIFEVVRNLFASLTTPALPPIISRVKNGYAVEVSPEDQGRAIGKHGKTIWAISAVVTAASVRRTEKQTPVKLLDPKKRSSGIQLPYRP